MRARLQFNRFPAFLFSLIFALAAAMLLGGTLGYVLKPATRVPGRTQVLVIHDNVDSSPRPDGCLRIHGHKVC